MAGRRILYLAILAGCGVFYLAYGEWLAYFVLMTVLFLPWFSLVLSLPAMLRFRCEPAGPAFLELGGEGELWLLGTCSLPMPPFRGKLRLRRCLTGESWMYQGPEDLPTEHCGGFTVRAESLRICDYLGLFAFPVRCRETKTILVRPKPVKVDIQRSLRRYTARAWRPKPGGGFAENHELRLYRPGDNLNQIHWKLSAKTGDLILRQPMEPLEGLVLLTMNLRGTPEALDRKLGRLLWLGEHLLEESIRFELRVLTGDGILTFPIGENQALQEALDTLLCSRAAEEGDLRQRSYAASWQYHIGGNAHEA